MDAGKTSKTKLDALCSDDKLSITSIPLLERCTFEPVIFDHTGQLTISVFNSTALVYI